MLAPFVEIRSKPLHEPVPPDAPEPTPRGTWLQHLRLARDSGRLIDPEELGFRPQVRFRRNVGTGPYRWWWNGLLYSKWQLLGVHELARYLQGGKWSRRQDNALKWRAPPVAERGLREATRQRRLAAVLTAVEARYLPVIERGVVHLSGADAEDWEQFVQSFDAFRLLSRLDVSADEILRWANFILVFVNRVDPLGGDWSELVRRAPRRSWDKLSGNALAALDQRVAAELLLLCYEDLARAGHVPVLEARGDAFHAEHERVSYRSQSLDANLAGLGISPHPGVVLVVEGETEEVLVPLVRDRIRIPRQAELIQSVVLRGVRHDLTKLAAFASAPLIERRQGDAWLVMKPPTRLMVVVDPDRPYDTAEGVDGERQKIIKEIIDVVRAQGVAPDEADIASLVSVVTWDEACFEFAHFSDEELADALLRLHPTCGGWDRQKLTTALSLQRANHQDIDKIWANWWPPQVRKRNLALELWPLLRDKLDQASAGQGAPVPPVARALVDAFQSAMTRPQGRFALRGSAPR